MLEDIVFTDIYSLVHPYRKPSRFYCNKLNVRETKKVKPVAVIESIKH